MQEAQEMWVRSLGREDPLEKEMATHSSPSPTPGPLPFFGPVAEFLNPLLVASLAARVFYLYSVAPTMPPFRSTFLLPYSGPAADTLSSLS